MPNLTNSPDLDRLLIAALAVALVAMIALYFLPTVIGYARQHERKGSIFLVDLFFGWTFVGWWFALIWAIVGKPEKVQPFYERSEPRLHVCAESESTRKCPHCGEAMKREATIKEI